MTEEIKTEVQELTPQDVGYSLTPEEQEHLVEDKHLAAAEQFQGEPIEPIDIVQKPQPDSVPHVHGPHCNHGHAEVKPGDELAHDPRRAEVTPEELARAEAAIRQKQAEDNDPGWQAAIHYVNHTVQEEQHILNTVPMKQIRDTLMSAPKGSKKYMIGRVLLLPTLLATQIRVNLHDRKEGMWEGLYWRPVLQSIQIMAFFIKEETRNQIREGMEMYPKIKDKIAEQARRAGIFLETEMRFFEEQVKIAYKVVTHAFSHAEIKKALMPQNLYSFGVNHNLFRFNTGVVNRECLEFKLPVVKPTPTITDKVYPAPEEYIHADERPLAANDDTSLSGRDGGDASEQPDQVERQVDV